MRRPLLLITLLAWIVGAAPAPAAVVNGSGFLVSSVEPPHTQVTVTDRAGEANEIVVSVEDGAVVVRDARSELHATGTCTATEPRVVRCPFRILEGLVADAGAGDDSVDLSPFAVEGAGARVAGGEGDDKLLGSRSGATLLIGGAGGDLVRGDADDIASYADSRTPVRVDLADGRPDGRRGERDRIEVPNVAGGPRDDVLAGDGRANRLSGEGGRDELRGRAGNDVLRGDVDVSGQLDADGGRDFADRLDGGPGADVLIPSRLTPEPRRGDVRDRVICGAGRDTVEQTDGRDVFARCEEHGLDAPDFLRAAGHPGPRARLQPVELGGRRARLRFSCVPSPRCRVRITLSSRGMRLGQVRGVIRTPGDLVEITVPFTRSGRDVARRGLRSLTVEIDLSSPEVTDLHGHWTIPLQRL